MGILRIEFWKIKLKNWKFGKIILKMEFRKIKFKNWKFGKLKFREWNFGKLNLNKNEILENYFENRNFWKIGIFENRNVKIEVLKIIFLMYENKNKNNNK